MCSSTLLQSTSSSSLSRLARARVPARCTRTVQRLSGLTLARVDWSSNVRGAIHREASPQPPPGSYLPRIPEYCGAGRHLALWCSLHVRHGLDITNSKRVRCKTHSDDALCVTIWLAWRRLSAFCCHQHVATIVSVTARIGLCSNMASAECSGLVLR